MSSKLPREVRYLRVCISDLKNELVKNSVLTPEISNLFEKISSDLRGNTDCLPLLIETLKSLWEDVYVSSEFITGLSKTVKS